MRVAAAGVLVVVLLLAGAWQGWRAITPANSMPAGEQLKQAKSASAAALSEPAALSAAHTATGTSHAALAKPKSARRAAPIALPPPDMGNSSAPPEITLLANPAGDASPISNVLAAPVAGPRLDDMKVSKTSGGKLIKKVDPTYPPGVAQGAHGEVVLKAAVNRKGQVTKVRVLSGQPVLARAAIAAVMRWRYEPFLLNGVPIEVENDIVLNFKAPGQ
jgi:TonB family protein